MFGMFESIAKAAVGVVVDLPLSVAADVVTLGGLTSDKPTTYTEDAAGRILKNAKNAVDPKR